jgi:uncharacterized protein YqgC (DUF456 family)
MEIAILTIGFILLIIGLVSCILPPLPGPPIAFIALLLLYFFYPGIDIPAWMMVTLGIISFAITYLDNLVAVWGTQKFGGTKAGIRGSFIGLIIGVLLSPIFTPAAIFGGTLLGAFAGELAAGNSTEIAIKSALGSFIGFLLGIGLKLLVAIFITYKFIAAIL